MLDIALLAFPDGSIWIFASLDDCSVRLFTIDQDDKFQEGRVLKGKSILHHLHMYSFKGQEISKGN